MTERKPTPVLFLDLDGTVRLGERELGYYAKTPADIRVFDGVPAILRAYRDAGWRIVGISNQGGIALGHLTPEQVEAMSLETIAQCKWSFDGIVFCPHHPQSPDPAKAFCWCRKPKIGLLVQGVDMLCQKYNGEEDYPLHLALLVGDLAVDQACAQNAGIRFVNAVQWRNTPLARVMESLQ